MWKIFILTIFQLVCVVQMIINGYNVNSIKERPFQVAINSGYIPYFSADYNCSGSIISKDFVLTAAHCLRHNLTYVVRVGTIYGVWFGNVHDIEKISVHPNYTFSPYIRNDVALLKVRPEIEFESSVQPIELADIYFPKYVDLITTVSGYGANCLVCNAVGRLQAVDLSTITNKECGETFDNLYENQICATGSFLKTGTTCKGDSGGPVTVLLSNGKKILFGVLSIGYYCEQGKPVVATFVPAIRNWIETITGV